MVKNSNRPQMAMQGKAALQMTPGLMMMPQMQQALHLMQLPIMELEPFIEEQVALNPLLEISEAPKAEEEKESDLINRLDEEWQELYAEAGPVRNTKEDKERQLYFESSLCAEPSLYEVLIQEAHETFSSEEDFRTAEILIGYIDEAGYLKTSLQEIAALHNVSEGRLKSVLDTIQTFEPYGVGAASIQETLLIQLRCLNKTDTLAYRIVSDFYEEMLHNRLPRIQEGLRCSLEEVEKAIREDIAALDLHPGQTFSRIPTQGIVPDVTLREENGELKVEADRESAPPLRLNKRYLKMLRDPELSQENKQYLKQHLTSARWLVRNLENRYSTLEGIAHILAKSQRDFFLQVEGKLTPMTMKQIAEELNVHESTVARTVSNKYISCPKGIYPLRYFFTNKYISEKGEDLSSKTVQEAIRELIAQEDKRRPLSDAALSALLGQRGIPCARRTVAKLRGVMELGTAQQRKRYV